MARDPELWRRIRDDYLATGASYSELAKRHGVSLSKVKHVAAKEMWTSGGLDAINTAEDARKTAGRSLNRIEPSNEPEGQIEPIPIEPGEPIEPENEPEREEEIQTAGEWLIPQTAPEQADVVETPRDRYERFMEITDSMMDRIADALASPDVINPYALKLLASALRDVREMQGLNKSELDREEQRLRIAKLRREADNQIRMDEVFTVEFENTEGAEV